MGLTYEDAGVDIAEGERLVDRIKPLAAATRIPEVLGSVGGFAGLCGLPTDIADPVLVSGTDGVGTKLEVAIRAGKHDTVGIDLVAMCVNDIVTVGARPLFFLDYFATGKLEVAQGEAVVRGIAEGCKQAGCALLGGETAELPGFYDGGRYDLAGFAVGVVDRSAILDGKAVAEGDVLLGVASSGLHSNGYSLARRALIEGDGALPLDAPADGMDRPLGEVMLDPTRIYVKAALAAIGAGGVHALCHVTGGGLPGNLPRVLPEGHGAFVDGSWDEPAIFDLIRRRGDVAQAEMRRTFNLGIGFVVVAAADSVDAITAALEGAGESVVRLGSVERSDAEGEARVRYAS
ncbi:MAG: phosphoribosylformylglycinamidine cyclo-ligase [Deltaproteobacteria bacterium]|nr:phosphoribosylformylglycinamidine cyclo-ligase [Deltaproteobacteria bacterium]